MTFFFFLNSTLKSQSTSSKPTGPKETSPMYSYTIHKYSIYIYLNPQQTGWTTRFSSRDCATFAFSSSNNTATLDCIATLQERSCSYAHSGKQPGIVCGASSSDTFPGETVVACPWHNT